MKKSKCMCLIFLGFLTIFGICQGADISTVNLFNMSCSVQKTWGVIPHPTTKPILYTMQSGVVYQTTFSGNIEVSTTSAEYMQLYLLGKRGFQNITSIETLSIQGTKFIIIQGTKCSKPTIRINGMNYTDDLGVKEIKENSGNLQIRTNNNRGLETIISCDPATYGTISTKYQVSSSKEQVTGNLQPVTGNLPIITKDADTYNQLKVGTLYDMVKERGLDRKKDRNDLANQAGIQDYIGTKEQNLHIKSFLLDKIQIIQPDPTNIIPTQTKIIYIPATQKAELNKAYLRLVVKQRGYVWKHDRMRIAKEFGFSSAVYYGTLAQNLQIRAWLLSKIVVK